MGKRTVDCRQVQLGLRGVASTQRMYYLLLLDDDGTQKTGNFVSLINEDHGDEILGL